VLVFHTAAWAQQSPPSKGTAADATAQAAKPNSAAPQSEPQVQQELPPGNAPAGYPSQYPSPPPPEGYPQPSAEQPYYYHQYDGPPPYGYGYPPPPPRYYRRYPPPPPMHYYERPITYRPFSFGVGLGLSGLAFFPNGASNASRLGLGYNFRFGFGIDSRWSVMLAADGASAYFNNNLNITETLFTVGPQVFLTPKLYVRAGIGAAVRSYSYGYYSSYGDSGDDSGFGGTLAVGMEFLQSYHLGLGLEACGTVGYYSNQDTLSTFGINFVMNLF
jgi:hypothetical protein